MKDINKIEKKWQDIWEETNLYKFDEDSPKEKLYALEMFSYPSGANLHIGHWWNYGVADTWSRLNKMEGYNVFHPMGFDAFGLPAENYAIETGVHPKDSTDQNIATMQKQLREIGATYDWDYEINTSSKDYYKWTQWMFLKLYENDLAYKMLAPVNWCPSCQTVLANEQVEGGVCERCKSEVERKEMNQWFFRITKYAEELLNDLDDLDWPERTKTLQRNWIGKSTGASITFKVNDLDLEVFTTRPDTIYGVTYMVLSPEHKLVPLITKDEYKDAVEKYKELSRKQSEIERTDTTREKTGVFTGAYAINPVSKKEIPIYIADYVLNTYGTGAIMAVPAHDERDYQFALKYNLEIIKVIDSNSDMNLDDGVHINSGILNGLYNEEAIFKMNKYLGENNLGKKTTTYRLRDWLVSRQRYWGSPIPIVYCDKCGEVPVSYDDLPVVLPYEVEFTPDGDSPLKKSEEFVNTTCPKCGSNAKRETDTLDTFVCSSWYFLRYIDNKNDKMPFDKEKINKFLPVDKYVGGIEHACMHLLYARFFTKALRDMGYLNFSEPFKSLVHQGIILGEDGEKMSKSIGNTVSPDEIVAEYGADILRGYLMFGFNYVDGGPWTADGIIGINKYYQRVERLISSISDDKEIDELEVSLHKTIKSVKEDTNNFQFNTSIARIMEYTNSLVKYEKEGVPRRYIENLLLILAPFAPHITEELWSRIGNEYSIHNMSYPVYDESKIKTDTFELGVQVNGKVRATISVHIDDTEEIVKERALSSENVLKHTFGLEIVKVIYVPNKIVSIVAK